MAGDKPDKRLPSSGGGSWQAGKLGQEAGRGLKECQPAPAAEPAAPSPPRVSAILCHPHCSQAGGRPGAGPPGLVWAIHHGAFRHACLRVRTSRVGLAHVTSVWASVSSPVKQAQHLPHRGEGRGVSQPLCLTASFPSPTVTARPTHSPRMAAQLHPSPSPYRVNCLPGAQSSLSGRCWVLGSY